MPDLAAARQFVHSHARLLERRRFEYLHGDAQSDPEPVLRAVEAYKNADGGFGLLEPDLRTPASQPSAVLYAFEVLEELPGDARPQRLTTAALDWIATIANADGGIPFVTPSADGFAHAPWWAPVDPAPSSLLMTAGVASVAHRLGLDHPWLATANTYIWDQLRHLELGDAYAFRYVVHFLDAVADRARADAELRALRERMPDDGVLAVEAGIEGETLGVLEVAPGPDHAGRRLFPAALADEELAALAAAQQDDGGWDFSWSAWNPAVAWEWRGMVTIAALNTLKANNKL
jgi:hypothetical protein